MEIYDKAAWHIDGGEVVTEVMDRFKTIFDFLYSNNMLNDEGIEMREYCMDESISLNSDLLNEKGKQFIETCYDNILKHNPDDIRYVISNVYDEFIKGYES